MNYDEAVKFLTSNDNFYIDLGLERILSALEILGNPQDSLRCIHVAGTNGKGSVCNMLESILREAGYKTALYTSPHIWEYTERIKISSKEISNEKFAYYTEKIKETGVHLTEFEILTVLAFLYFNDEKPDIVILETGLGGRLDATNVIKQNVCSVITHLDLDHTDRLGSGIEDIAFEKAGIIKNNCPVVTGMDYKAIINKAKIEHSEIIRPYSENISFYSDKLALKGIHQCENLALVLAVIKNFFADISEEVIVKGLKNTKNPCRFEYYKEENMIVDAAHNPNGIEVLRINLDKYYPEQNRRYIFGCLNTKDYEKMMKILFREGDEVYLNEFHYPKACTYKELSGKCPVKNYKYTSSLKLTKDKLNIICGSFYMISGMKFLSKHK